MTLTQAQDRYIQRVNHCHPGHYNRVRRSAWSELFSWAKNRGYDAVIVCQDADDVAKLERNAED